MTAVLVLVALVVLVWGYVAYGRSLKNGFRSREIVTTLDEARLRQLLTDHVANAGWHVASVDPLVAQSSLATGIPQQIGLSFGTDTRHPGATAVQISVLRYSRSSGGGTPNKAHARCHHIHPFVEAVQAADPSAVVDDGLVMRGDR